MARSRRRSARPIREKKDWVYLTNSYSVDSILLQPGSPSAVALPLTISQNARREIVFGGATVEPTWLDIYQVQSGAAMPEGSKLRIYAVDGHMMVFPNDWTAGAFVRLGMRLMHGVMDNTTGQLSQEAGYSMWENTTADDITQWANAGFLREWYDMTYVPSGVAGLVSHTAKTYKIRWSNPKGITLGNDRAMWLYLETAFNSRECTLWPRLRCLVGTF